MVIAIDITQNLGKTAHTATADLSSSYDSKIANWKNKYIFGVNETGHKLTQYGSGTVVCAGIGGNYDSNNFVYKYAD